MHGFTAQPSNVPNAAAAVIYPDEHSSVTTPAAATVTAAEW